MGMNNIVARQYLEACGSIAYDAGRLIMTYFRGDFTTQQKSDHSPVTDADIAANRLIVNRLRALTRDIPVISEEDLPPTLTSPPFTGGKLFWLVDPLDGTKSFVRREPEFSVNIGLIMDRRPLLGVIYAPPQERLYYGGKGLGAFRKCGDAKAEAIRTRPPPDAITVTRSRSHPSAQTNAYMQRFQVGEVIGMSSAVKFCLLAEGQADIYPRFGRTMEWDTAAGHAILEAAGGRIETAGGAPLLYGKSDFENPPFIAFGYPA